MTFLDSSLWRKFLAESRVQCAITLLLLLLSACAADETFTGGEHRRVKKSLSGKFEWAVQYYEAGNYFESIKVFERLRKEGSEVPEYDLISFYMGMSHYRMRRFEDAAKELENFLRSGTVRQENQDARISLLLAYEQLSRWKSASSLAAETDKLTLFQNNRALLKLIWARALREQGEILGAKSVLEDSLPYLDKMGTEESSNPVYSDPDQDLWGRYHFTSTLVREMDCNRSGPKEIKAKAKKARPKRLYLPWLESVTDCFRKSVDSASEELFSRESPWSVMAEQSLSQGISVFVKKIEGYLKEEAANLDKHRSLQKISREQLYRLLSSVDENLKNFKNRGLASKSLESLRKQIDRLLVLISGPS